MIGSQKMTKEYGISDLISKLMFSDLYSEEKVGGLKIHEDIKGTPLCNYVQRAPLVTGTTGQLGFFGSVIATAGGIKCLPVCAQTEKWSSIIGEAGIVPSTTEALEEALPTALRGLQGVQARWAAVVPTPVIFGGREASGCIFGEVRGSFFEPSVYEYLSVNEVPSIVLSTRQVLLLQLIDRLLKDRVKIDEPTIQRFVYVRSKGAIKKGLKPLYEKFIRTQFGPFNEELWSDVRTLKEEGMIALEKCKIKLSEEARRLLLDASGKEAMKYLGEEAFNLNQIYPLEGMKEVDIGSELP